MRGLIKVIASGLGVGYSRFAPGTIASIWGVLLYLLLHSQPVIFIIATAVLFVLGFSISSKAEEVFAEKDSGIIVIDEVASMCLVCLFIKPAPFALLTGFLLFRFFDIIKPWPVRIVERLTGSMGIMLDDIVAAVYTIMVMLALYILSAAGICPVLYRLGLGA